MVTRTRYTRVGDQHIAYQTLGEGPIDLVVSVGYLSHVEHVLAEPRLRSLYERFGSFARVIAFDRRGSGLSDPIDRPLTLAGQADDLRAVLDAVGSERAVVFGHTVGAPYALMFAASEPERVSHLVLFAGFARMTRADDYPWANTPQQRAAVIDLMLEHWGTGAEVAQMAPSAADDPAFREWYAALQRLSSGPGAARRFFGMIGELDVRPILPSVHQPTLVMHPRGATQIDARHSHYLADHLPNARFVELPGADVIPVGRELRDRMGDEIEEFVTGSRLQHPHDRALRTVVFTDIVDSTARAAALGDRQWHDVLDRHDALVRRELERFRGREVKTTGDGFFAAFDGPERAVRCALAIGDAVGDVGVAVRAGVHTGECELRGDDLSGLAVHIGARVAARAGGHEVLVSQTVRDLVVGSELGFDDRGEYELKGVPGRWRLFAASAG